MPFAFRPQRRSGLTLVEILIALTMTLVVLGTICLLYTSPSPRDATLSRMPSSA